MYKRTEVLLTMPNSRVLLFRLLCVVSWLTMSYTRVLQFCQVCQTHDYSIFEECAIFLLTWSNMSPVAFPAGLIKLMSAVQLLAMS